MNDNLRSEMIRYGNMLAAKYKAQLKIDKTYATGQTYNSIESRVTETGNGVSIDILADRTLEAIDTGRRAGGARPPSWSKILIWAQAKGIRPRDKKTNRFKTNSFINMKRMSIAIAIGIQRKGTIKRYGYQGSGIIDFVFKQLREELETSLDTSFRKDIENEIETKTKIKWQTKN